MSINYDELNNNQKVNYLNYEIDQLTKKREEVKRSIIDTKAQEVTKIIIEHKEKLTERDLMNLLRNYYFDIRDIINE
jgi:hypothetical protein